MSDWESTTKIGSKFRGAGAAPRENTIRSQSALNAAQRSGAILSTEKKYATGNAIGKGGGGQHLTKVDRSDDIVKLGYVNPKVSEAARKRRNEEGFKMTIKELAMKCNVQPPQIASVEAGTHKTGDDLEALLNKMELHLKVWLHGSNIGSPKEKVYKRNNNPAKK
ncbi:hypothetical protein N7456_000297 [Penicillium angulare]|uniref:Multiprotein-bridging factor 1 n=1 Tax=Penicillium angulare TaxID=116970 RepID=A0A9W9GBS0_9EURO|nr:hypothetical protein N7456_000297 [Penicillium angulare]